MSKIISKTSFLLFLILFSFCDSKEKRKISVKSIKEIESFTFPGRIHRFFVDNENIHVYGSPYDKILSYDKNWSLTKEVGQPGPANWEITSVWWYDENLKSYTIYDYGKNLINKFNRETNDLVSSFKFSKRSNIIKWKENVYLSSFINDDGEFQFGLLDIENNFPIKIISVSDLLKEVGIEEQKDLDFLLYGDFANSEKNPNTFVYYCLNSPIFFKIDLKKMEVNLFKDFRFEFMPEIYRVGKRVVLNPNQNWFMSGTIIDDNMYFLTIENNEFYVKKTSKWFLDVYDGETGIYKESLLVDPFGTNFPFEIRSRDNKLIIGFDFEKIKLYEIRN